MSRPEHREADPVPRTFRFGPSDPVRLADGPGTWVETVIAARPDAVWTAVTDIDLPAQFSEEFLGAEWTSEERGLGASFRGRNRHPVVGEWEVESFVDQYTEGRVFGWATSDPDNPGARWRFRLEPAPAGTLLRFELTIGPGPSGITAAIESVPDKEARIIDRRIIEHHANMTRTVRGIRELLEADPLEAAR